MLQNIGGVAFISSSLQTNVESGIPCDNFEIARRQRAFGSNTYSKPPSKAFLRFLVESFQDFTVLVLLTCAVLSLCFGIKQYGLKEGWHEGASIFVVVSFVIVMSSITNFMYNKVVDESRASNSLLIDVVRNGRLQKISTPEIVVGDVVFLKMGDYVPADGLFLDGNSLLVEESSINENHPFLFSDTKVVDGYGKMLVTCVGVNTTRGQMMSSTSHKAHNTNNEPMPLQARLNELTSLIGKVSLAMAVLVVVVVLIRYFAGNTTDKNENREFDGRKTKLNDMVNAVVRILADAITIVVVATPLGLQLAVKLTLAYSMKKMMAEHQAMVRNLPSCETMGSTTVICTNKTGTLTVNEMKVTKFCVGLAECACSSSVAPCVVGLIREGVALNTTGGVFHGLNSDSILEFLGSPTEKAILSWAVLDLNLKMELITQNCHILRVKVFNSKNKRSGVMIRRKADKKIHVHWKGPAEMILKLCSSYFDASGIVRNLDDNDASSKFEDIIQTMGSSGLRCIAFATKQVLEEQQLRDEKGNRKVIEDGLTLLGIVGIKNPCRVGVKTAVEACQNAGVDIKMITGDDVCTAKTIASECGILGTDHDQDTYNGAVVEAEEFRNYTHEERLEKIDKIRVMASSSPADKLLMVQCLKQKHHVISVSTGNEIDDAPVLKEADIGISMDKNDSKEARESSDIFIGSDNGFLTLVAVLMFARLVQDDIHKLIEVQLTANIVALVLNSMIMAVLKREVPKITAFGYIGACLIIYAAYFLSLAVNVAGKSLDELMENPPRAVRGNRNVIWRKVLTRAFYMITVLFIMQLGFGKSSLFSADSKGNIVSLIFDTFVLYQVYSEFHAEQIPSSILSARS